LYSYYAISYGLWIVTLGLLAKAFFHWYRLSSKNIMVLIFTLSMIAYVANGVAGLATNIDILKQQKPVISSSDIATKKINKKHSNIKLPISCQYRPIKTTNG
jgi:succinate dehydrogenase/fumarate reductase cytochrome b subunit